jgi:hypothetical protein
MHHACLCNFKYSLQSHNCYSILKEMWILIKKKSERNYNLSYGSPHSDQGSKWGRRNWAKCLQWGRGISYVVIWIFLIRCITVTTRKSIQYDFMVNQAVIFKKWIDESCKNRMGTPPPPKFASLLCIKICQSQTPLA